VNLHGLQQGEVSDSRQHGDEALSSTYLRNLTSFFWRRVLPHVQVGLVAERSEQSNGLVCPTVVEFLFFTTFD